jgi:hypothetical protein
MRLQNAVAQRPPHALRMPTPTVPRAQPFFGDAMSVIPSVMIWDGEAAPSRRLCSGASYRGY